MTSTCGGDDGPSFGFVNRDYIKDGKIDLHFNNLRRRRTLVALSRGRAVQPLVQARRRSR